MARYARHRFAIRPHRPWRDLLEAGLVFVLLGIAGYVVLDQRINELHRSIAELRQGNARLTKSNTRLAADNTVLRKRAIVLERSRGVDDGAYAEVDQRLVALQRENLDLRRQVAFYRGVVRPASGSVVSIQRLLIEPDGAGGFRFELVLTRGRNDGKVVAGTVGLSVVGEVDGHRQRLKLAELSGTGGPGLEFRFKYFQRLQGHLSLPESFRPQQVSVRVVAAKANKVLVEKDFAWFVTQG